EVLLTLEPSGEHGGATPTKNEQERSEEFGRQPARHRWHRLPPCRRGIVPRPSEVTQPDVSSPCGSTPPSAPAGGRCATQRARPRRRNDRHAACARRAPSRAVSNHPQ